MNELELERRLAHVEDRSKSNSHRLDELERQGREWGELVRSVAAIAQKQEDMDGDVREIKSDVKGLLAVPSERWKSAVTAAVTAVIGALIGAVVS